MDGGPSRGSGRSTGLSARSGGGCLLGGNFQKEAGSGVWVRPTLSLHGVPCPAWTTTASAVSVFSLLGVPGWEGLRPSPLTGESVGMETGDFQGPPGART